MKLVIKFDPSIEADPLPLPLPNCPSDPIVYEDCIVYVYDLEQELDASGELMLDTNPAVISYRYVNELDIDTVNELMEEAVDEIIESLDRETRERWSWMLKMPGSNLRDAVWYYVSDEIVERTAKKAGVSIEELFRFCQENGIPTSWSEYTNP